MQVFKNSFLATLSRTAVFVIGVILATERQAEAATIATASQVFMFNTNTGSPAIDEVTKADLILNGFDTSLGTLNAVFIHVAFVQDLFNSVVPGSYSTLKVTSAISPAELFLLTEGPYAGNDIEGSCDKICVSNLAYNPWKLANSLFLSPIKVTASSDAYGAASGTMRVNLIYDYSPVPLPTSLSFALLGLIGLGALRIHRKYNAGDLPPGSSLAVM